MFSYLRGVIILWSICQVAVVYAHEAPIDVFVDAATNRLFTLQNFAAGRFIVDPGEPITTTTPGIGITFPTNGVTFGTRLYVDAFPGLYYWNGGSTLVPTSETFTWDPPKFDVLNNPTGASGHYVFSEDSDVQLGMDWATYINTFFWEADGTHKLPSLNAAPGIYGTVIRLRSDRNLASLPFVVPFIYDPQDQWDLQTEDMAVALMRALAPTAMPGDFDQDDDFDCVDVDSLVAQIVAGVYDPAFDRNRDGAVDVLDLDQWRIDAASHNLVVGGAILPGDANLDGVVDGSDFSQWNAHKFTATASWCSGDFNADGAVDLADFEVWNGNKFQRGEGQVVPEPCSAWTFFVLAGVVHALCRRVGRQ